MRFGLPCVGNSELVFQNTENGNEKAVCTLMEGASKVHISDILITSLLGCKQTVAPPQADSRIEFDLQPNA